MRKRAGYAASSIVMTTMASRMCSGRKPTLYLTTGCQANRARCCGHPSNRRGRSLVGLFALGGPVFNLMPRDEHIGWSVHDRESRLYHVMDAYILGAVPPYSFLLGGKAVALAAIWDEVRQAFASKYRGRTTVIEEKQKTASLVLVTTTSAIGRSSIYNRLRISEEAEPIYRSVGYSRGWSHFHFSDEVFGQLRD